VGATHGSLEQGKFADLACFQAEDWRELCYWIPGPKIIWTMKGGEIVAGRT
jgi:imidazolonepropionase-like amidohydrolase